MNIGTKKLVFVIGGAYGFSKEIYDVSNQLFSLSNDFFASNDTTFFCWAVLSCQSF